MVRHSWAVVPLALLLAWPAHSAPSFTLSAELGPELDSNANRATGDVGESVASPLLRGTLSTALKLKLGRRHLLGLDYGGGAKLFTAEGARGADEVVQLGGASWGIRLASAVLWLSGSYYDAFQRVSSRDFRSGAGSGGITFAVAGGQATLSAGYRGLGYKPDPAYSFHGATASALLAWRLSSGKGDEAVEWELRAGYSAGVRAFAGDARATPGRCEGTVCTEPVGRDDLHHSLRTEVGYLGNAELSLGYLLEANRSNSYGESYTRHALVLKFTSHIVWGLYVSAKGTLQLSRFEDPYLVSEVSSLSFTSIDDENRSSLVLQLARDLGERWSVLLRYGLYVNESTSRVAISATELAATGFLRHTLFLGARFEYSR